MERRQLRYFVGISEAGSLLKASARLHVAQPSLSQQVAALEHAVGARLFDRSSRGITLTEAGKVVLEHAQVVLAELESEGDDMQAALVSARARKRPGPRQRELFHAPVDPIVAELEQLDVDGLSPRQALDLLARLKQQAGLRHPAGNADRGPDRRP